MRFVSRRSGFEPASRRRRACLLALGSACATSLACSRALAAPRSIEAFGPETWRAWQASLARPAIVVFTTTYCPTCPEAFAYLADANTTYKLRATLIAVVMDGEGQANLLRNAHYAVADRMFVFAGQETALRYGVDPRWRGVTPYVALFGSQAAPTLVAGRPPLEQLQRELRR